MSSTSFQSELQGLQSENSTLRTEQHSQELVIAELTQHLNQVELKFLRWSSTAQYFQEWNSCVCVFVYFCVDILASKNVNKVVTLNY